MLYTQYRHRMMAKINPILGAMIIPWTSSTWFISVSRLSINCRIICCCWRRLQQVGQGICSRMLESVFKGRTETMAHQLRHSGNCHNCQALLFVLLIEQNNGGSKFVNLKQQKTCPMFDVLTDLCSILILDLEATRFRQLLQLLHRRRISILKYFIRHLFNNRSSRSPV